MKVFDSHCHIDDRTYNNDIEEVLRRARQAEVYSCMVVGVTLETSKKALAMAETYEGLYSSVGIHPHDASECTDKMLEELEALAQSPRVKAWGETGLDFNRMHSPQEDQERCFKSQVEIAKKLNLPMIFHERDSGGRFLEILREVAGEGINGVVHCFSGNEQEMKGYLDLGLHIGITGIVTIKKRGEDLRKLIPMIPAERILVETDAPYLTPTPERNKVKRNEPAFVRRVLMKTAEVRGVELEPFAAQVWENTCGLFKV